MTWMTFNREAGFVRLPGGAKEIYELRQAGKRPSEMVLVSLIGPLPDESNPVVLAVDKDYDWRFLHGIDCMIVANMETPPGLIKRIADEVVAVEPSYAGIVWADRNDGLHLCWGSYKPKAKWMRRWTSYERGLYGNH